MQGNQGFDPYVPLDQSVAIRLAGYHLYRVGITKQYVVNGDKKQPDVFHWNITFVRIFLIFLYIKLAITTVF